MAAALPGLGRMPGRLELAQGALLNLPADRGEAAEEGGDRRAMGLGGEAAGPVAPLLVPKVTRDGVSPAPDGAATATGSQGTVAEAGAAADEGDGGTVGRLRALLMQSLAGSCEGLMLKRLDGAYEPSKRAPCWPTARPPPPPPTPLPTPAPTPTPPRVKAG